MLVPCFVIGAQSYTWWENIPLAKKTEAEKPLKTPFSENQALPFRRQFQSVVACGNIRYEEDLIAGTLVRMKAFAGLLSQDCPFYPRNLPQTLFNSEQSPNMPSLQVSKGDVGRIMRPGRLFL